jgi:hypothetical protein
VLDVGARPADPERLADAEDRGEPVPVGGPDLGVAGLLGLSTQRAPKRRSRRGRPFSSAA